MLHTVESYDVQQRTSRFFFSSYTTVDRVSNLNYTFRSLSPSTVHYFRVAGVSSVSLRTSYSAAITVTTHPQGMKMHATCHYVITPVYFYYSPYVYIISIVVFVTQLTLK